MNIAGLFPTGSGPVYVLFSIPFLLDQEVILLRHSLLMDQVPVFLPMEPRLAPYGRPL